MRDVGQEDGAGSLIEEVYPELAGTMDDAMGFIEILYIGDRAASIECRILWRRAPGYAPKALKGDWPGS